MELKVDLVWIHEEIASLMDETSKRNFASEKPTITGGLELDSAKLFREAFLYPASIAGCLVIAVSTTTAILVKCL